MVVTQVTWVNAAGGNGIASGTANWSIAGLGLTEGENVIAVTARDEANNESTDVLTVTYTIPDTTAPVVAITSPTSDTLFNTETASLGIGGTSSDATGVTQVTWSNSAGGNGTASGTDTWDVTGISLTEGENVIIITARDAAGNESTDQLAVTYTIPDTTEPVIVISSPTSDTIYSTGVGNITISGTASDNKRVTQVSWVNSAGGNGIASGTDNWSIAGLGLSEGKNVVTVTAGDATGNKSSDLITIQYTAQTIDITPPAISLTSPTTGSYLFTRSASVSLSGTASDNIGIKEILWNNSKGGSGKASGTSEWNATDIALSRYWNTITITAIDFSDNKSVYTLNIFSWQ
jgi:molybdopterin-binding protein